MFKCLISAAVPGHSRGPEVPVGPGHQGGPVSPSAPQLTRRTTAPPGLPRAGGQEWAGRVWPNPGPAPRAAGPAPLRCAALRWLPGRALPAVPLPSRRRADAAAPAQLRPESGGGGARPRRRPG